MLFIGKLNYLQYSDLTTNRFKYRESAICKALVVLKALTLITSLNFFKFHVGTIFGNSSASFLIDINE